MPKRNKKNRSKRMRGGWPWDSASGTDSTSSSGTGWFDSLKKNASSATGSTSGWFSSATPTTTTTSPTTPAATATTTTSPSDTPPPPSVTGGKKRRSRRMRGGYSDNISTNNLAASAGAFSGSTARAQAYVGGRTKRRCRKHKRSHRHRCRK